ncbi:MAG: hypothetical protein WAL91_06510 [Propionicimonas sp.]
MNPIRSALADALGAADVAAAAESVADGDAAGVLEHPTTEVTATALTAAMR